MPPPIKLVALDLDGTLVGTNEHIPKTALEALARAANRGILITTASGRDLIHQESLFSKYGLGAASGLPHFLTTNEAYIYRADAGNYVPFSAHNDPLTREWARLIPTAIDIVVDTVAQLCGEGFEAKRASSDDFAASRCLIDFTVVGDPGAQRALELLKERTACLPELRPNCVQGHQKRYHLQITPSSGGKGVTLLALARILGMEPASILAVGDSGNDRDLLAPQRGFRTATVANADADIKALIRDGGGYESPHERGDGVADILAHIGLA